MEILWDGSIWRDSRENLRKKSLNCGKELSINNLIMQDFSQDGNWFSLVADIRTSKQGKSWFSSVADAYNRTRPNYSQTIINRAVELAKLPEDATILEIGCGPGNATKAFGQLGFKIICLEPSESACHTKSGLHRLITHIDPLVTS
ncbi:MAG: hypothetical protein F6K47_06035 [Symploca sp. SIO2E6]|nr:hypothetical protein [Symploca sp. SIO2E6]